MVKLEPDLWYVSRQVNTYNGIYYVEIAQGGCDFSNPGQLVGSKGDNNYEGRDPREALKWALDMRDRWRLEEAEPLRDEDDEIYAIEIYLGCTSGYTAFFDSNDLKTDEELTSWAQNYWDNLEKCANCGDLLPTEYYYYQFDEEGQRCCSDYCTDQYAYNYHKEMGDLVCFKCNEWVMADEAVMIDKDSPVCPDCFAKYWELCEKCEKILEEGRIGLCDDCEDVDAKV